MKVLHLPDTFLPDTTGGKEIFVYKLIKELDSIDVKNIVVIHGKHPNGLQEYSYNNIKVYSLPALSKTFADDFTLQARPIMGFEELLEKEKPDIIHFHDQINGASLSHLNIIKKKNLKTILTYHSPGQSCCQRALLFEGKTQCKGEINERICSKCQLINRGIPKNISNLISRISLPISLFKDNIPSRFLFRRALTNSFKNSFYEFISLVDKIQVHSKWSYDLLVLNHISQSKIKFIKLGILEKTSSSNNEKIQKQPLDPFKIVFSGRCNYTKGIHVLIDAIDLIPKSYNIEIHVIGPYWNDKGYPSEQLQKISHNSRWKQPILLAPQEVLPFISNMDVCIIPSIWKETGPIVLHEALSTGLPVIGSNLGGISELITDGQNGLLFETGNHKDLAIKIMKLIDDKELYSTIKKNIKPPRSIHEFAIDIKKMYVEIIN